MGQRLGVALTLVVVLAGVSAGAYVLGRTSNPRPNGNGASLGQPSAVASTTSTTSTQPTDGISTTTTTFEGPTLPLVMDCGQGAPYSSRPPCIGAKACSSSMQGISWRNWGTSTATGVGTLITRTTTVPATTPIAIGHYSAGLGFTSCNRARDVYHAGTPIVLSNPALESLCQSGQSKSVWLLTRVVPSTVATVDAPGGGASGCSGS